VTPTILRGFTSGWSAVHGPDGWILIEPLAEETDARRVTNVLPGNLPERFVILTAANPGGVELGDDENRARYTRLLERIDGLEPFPRETPTAFPAVGGLPHGSTPQTWHAREEGVAIDLSREEASMLAAEFGQLAWYSFEDGRRLLIATDDGTILAAQPYRCHSGGAHHPER
jgi:hypothetical protein